MNTAALMEKIEALPSDKREAAEKYWTTDANEVAVLSTRPGWTYERVSGYLLATQAPGSVPLYRLLYPNSVVHLWPTDAFERQVLVTQRGWVDEGVVGFVVP